MTDEEFGYWQDWLKQRITCIKHPEDRMNFIQNFFEAKTGNYTANQIVKILKLRNIKEERPSEPASSGARK